MKIHTEHFGILDVKPKRIFEHKNIKYAVVSYPYKYLNSEDTSFVNRCVHFETGRVIPVYRQYNKTVKDFIAKSLDVLDTIYKDVGEEGVVKELNKYEKINAV